MSRAAQIYDVYFFEEPVFRPGISARLEQRHDDCGVVVLVPILPDGLSKSDVEDAQQQLLDRFLHSLAGRELITWYYTPMALGFSAHLAPDVCVYDNMDELSAFRGAPPEMLALEARLFRAADVIFTGGQSLHEAKRGKHPNMHAFPSSIDAAHFARARTGQQAEPADQAVIGRPRLGYFGVIDERMDLNLVARLAELRPEWQIVMIGPTVKIDAASLPSGPNIHWLGCKQYGELPAYLAGWDAGIMPFALNESTRFISPTKTPEFLAAGVPVVSTAIADVIRPYGETGLVEIASGAADFAKKGEELLRRPKGDWLQRVDRQIAMISWDKTWAGMHALMKRSALQRVRRPDRQIAREPAHV